MMKIYADGLQDILPEVDSTMLRFDMAARLARMPYGDSVSIPNDIVMKAWPPTGDYDRSDLAVFRALALVLGGHRPEGSYTTEERITNDLDESFMFEFRSIRPRAYRPES